MMFMPKTLHTPEWRAKLGCLCQYQGRNVNSAEMRLKRGKLY